jgi:predicted nuclease with TOPRIM domain
VRKIRTGVDKVSDMDMKKKVNITVDPVVWKQARILGFNRSAICEEALRTRCGMGNQEEQLAERVKKLTGELSIAKRELQTLQDANAFIEETDKKSESDIDFIMETCRRWNERFGHVGINKITELCNRRQVDINLILNECKKNNYIIEQFLSEYD